MKQKITDALETGELEKIPPLLLGDRKGLSALVRLSYDKDTLVGRRAIKAMGLAARELVRTDFAFLRETCRKLLWSLTDESGGIGWSAPELLGEIVSADPKRFADIIPLIAEAYSVEEDVFRPGVVYALARIAESAPASVLEQQKIIIFSLCDKEPLARFYGLRLLGLIWEEACRGNAWTTEYRRKIQETVGRLTNDENEVWIFNGTGFDSLLIKDIARDIENKCN